MMRYRFADCILDVKRHELYRDGVLVPVEPQVFDILHMLVRNAGNLVNQDDIVREIWNGRVVSDSTISSRINAARRAVGDSGKNQQVIKTIYRRGFQLIALVSNDEQPSKAGMNPEVQNQQTVRFTTSPDGTRLAYAVSGSGPKVLRAGHFLTHLEKDWHSPIWRPYLDALGEHHTLIRYDQRGTGLSDPKLRNTSIEAYSADLKVIADKAGLDRFPLIATSQGVPIAIHFAAHHPERVSRLILYGGFALGRTLRQDDLTEEDSNTLLTMIRAGWGNPESAFMVAFTSLFCPSATPEEIANLVEIQLASATPENAAKIRIAIDRFSVIDCLDQVQAQTLVIHARNDSLHPVSQGQLLASRIRNSEFLQVESNNHIILPSDPVFQEIVAAKLEFLAREDCDGAKVYT